MPLHKSKEDLFVLKILICVFTVGAIRESPAANHKKQKTGDS
jgi:hypothetical protein